MAFRYLLLFLILFLAPTLSAAAPQPAGHGQKLLGHFGAWRAYSYDDKDQTVCYMALSVPSKKNKNFKRGATYLMITHRPGEASKDVISYTAGYNFKPASELSVKIGKQNFGLFTAKDTAWSHDTKTDHALTYAIRNSGSMIVTGFPAAKIQGLTSVRDTLNLTGSAAAYKTIGKACGYTEEEPKAIKKPMHTKK